MEPNRNPENFFAEVERAAFNPANVMPGIGFSPDKMLQGRLFSYGDAQRYRLGVNHHFIAVNAARTIGDPPREIQIRHIGNCLKAGPAYGKGIADALKIALIDVPS